jgi:GAF domain-containing protein
MSGDAHDEVIRVAEVFGTVARVLLESNDMGSTLRQIVDLAVEHLDACEFAGISFVEGARISSPAASSDLPMVLDAMQAELQEGPCFDAIKEHEIFHTGDLGAERDRWPRFAARAHEETGVSSILAVRLFAEANTMGALNMYSREHGAFSDSDVALATVFSTHAAVAMESARREEQLERKVASRDAIGRAKGILMTRMKVTDAQAFEMLRVASQRMNKKLTSVADDVNYTGDLPMSNT